MNIEKHETEEDLVMDLYFPNILTGMYGTPESPEEILEKLKEVDGDDSGLDADMLDGKHASAFWEKDKLLAGRVIVGGNDGGPADGGNYEEFVASFNSNLNSEEL